MLAERVFSTCVEKVVEQMDVAVGEAEKIWGALQVSLRDELSDAAWNTWFTGVHAETIAGDTLVLAAPSSVTAERIRSSYGGLIADTLVDLGGSCQSFELIVAPPRHAPEIEEEPRHEPPRVPRPSEHERAAPPMLNPRYTFDQFVAGSSNRAVREMALGVAEAPARYFNPFFIYGRSGLGKTHLMQAIGHHVMHMFPNKLVLYVSSETLLNDYVEAVRKNEWSDFKKRYRDIDVLLVDDIQFLEGKEGLQEEFFHTFNALHQSGSQIVLSSDRPPKAIATLEDRLRSRFEWGLTTDIQPPDLETRLAILQNKVESEGIQGIPMEVLTFIATQIHDNVRQLEGALIRISAYSSLNRAPLSEAVAREVLADLLPESEDRVITAKLVLDETAKKYGFSVDDLCGRSRRSPLVLARQIGMYVLRELTDYSYPRIAEEFGGRDHTTVMHAVDKIKTMMAEKRVILEQVNELISRIKLGTS